MITHTRQVLTLAAATLLSVVAAGRTAAVELVLRDRCVPRGAIVRLGDVADLVAIDADARKESLELPLTPSPAPGTQQRLSAAQLRDLLAASGVDAASWRLAGAPAVVIEAPSRSIEPAPAPAPRQITREAAHEQILAEVRQFLRGQTGHELWTVELEPNSTLIEAFCSAAVRPSITGGKAPWTGRQRFEFHWPDEPAGLGATVRVDRLEMAACAVRTIERGDFVRATDVVLRPVGGGVPPRAVATLEAAIGKEALQTIRTDSVVLSNQLRTPLVVRRGERVTVKAKAAGVVVRTYGTAREDGSLGDLIMVEALEGREKYAARVSGVRELEVFAAGAVAGEIAVTSR